MLFDFTLRMTSAEAVEMSVTTTNSLSQDYTNLDDHILLSVACCLLIYCLFLLLIVFRRLNNNNISKLQKNIFQRLSNLREL